MAQFSARRGIGRALGFNPENCLKPRIGNEEVHGEVG
jgi:hypothetical protein